MRPSVAVIVPFKGSREEAERVESQLLGLTRQPGDELIIVNNNVWDVPGTAGVDGERYVDGISLELVELALDCIPAAHLRKWCERILADVRENRTGFPDLIQFWPGQRRYRMIEVKGPGDRLQDNQLRWIDYCLEHGMPVEVCYLQWLEQAA